MQVNFWKGLFRDSWACFHTAQKMESRKGHLLQIRAFRNNSDQDQEACTLQAVFETNLCQCMKSFRLRNLLENGLNNQIWRTPLYYDMFIWGHGFNKFVNISYNVLILQMATRVRCPKWFLANIWNEEWLFNFNSNNVSYYIEFPWPRSKPAAKSLEVKCSGKKSSKNDETECKPWTFQFNSIWLAFF